MNMNIAAWIKLATRFFTVMFGAQHTTSWIEGKWSREKHHGRYLLYFTVDEEMADKAKAALENAGVLCHVVLDGPQHFSSE